MKRWFVAGLMAMLPVAVTVQAAESASSVSVTDEDRGYLRTIEDKTGSVGSQGSGVRCVKREGPMDCVKTGLGCGEA